MLFEATMDLATCHVVYVNRNVRADRHVCSKPAGWDGVENGVNLEEESADVKQDVDLLTTLFGEVHLCSTGAAGMAKVSELQKSAMVDLKPTLVLIDTPHDEELIHTRPRSRSTSPRSRPSAVGEVEIHTPDEEVYGLKLLQRIVTATHLQPVSKLIVPIPVVTHTPQEPPVEHDEADDERALSGKRALPKISVSRRLIFKCMELGAVDIMKGPLQTKCMTGLEILAYRAHQEALKDQQAMLEMRRGRKRSWVGISEEKPYAYLREAMVSTLMGRICRLEGLEDEEKIANVSIAVSSERQTAIAQAVGQWHFCAHDFTDDELLIAAMVMFRHALAMPELERWRIPTDQLLSFLVACRAAYNAFVPYHNFRHVVDVLQATFNFLVHIGTLAAYPQDPDGSSTPSEKSPIAALLHPFEGLTLLITAIGHDVGHPGVNNGFLVTLNAPLAQLYNDRSVLESFHCAAYSQILRTYWPLVFEDTKMRSLMISSILATDMGLHFDYMKRLGDLQEKLGVSNTTDGWNGRMLEEQKALACALLIKCADISNVARNHSTALQWMHILSDEFSRQAAMETELSIASSLLATPKKDITSLSKAQLGFMNMFAIPLFQGVADIMPAMRYTVDELELNKVLFEQKIQAEKAKEDPVRKRLIHDGTFSPRTMSFAVGTSQKEGSQETSSMPIADIATQSSVVDRKHINGEESSPQPIEPVRTPVYVSSASEERIEVNGVATSFEAVADFAASDPFHVRDRLNSCSESQVHHNGKQRCSEATDGSTTGPYSGDWASQATSATTGKMPLSPSTQGTSIVSRESLERPSSVPAHPVGTIPEIKAKTPEPKIEAQHAEEEYNGSTGSNGSISKAEGKLLKKKSSRFRMNAFPFFRRHRGSSPPIPAADTAG